MFIVQSEKKYLATKKLLSLPNTNDISVRLLALHDKLA